jgi:hypothetical protein
MFPKHVVQLGPSDVASAVDASAHRTTAMRTRMRTMRSPFAEWRDVDAVRRYW